MQEMPLAGAGLDRYGLGSGKPPNPPTEQFPLHILVHVLLNLQKTFPTIGTMI